MPRTTTAASRNKPAAPDARRARARAVADALARAIPEPRCELDFASPFQLLIATILSAQTTDKGVNKVTPVLFARYPDAAALAAAPQADVEAIVRSTGFYRQKARHIREAAGILVRDHGGEVPRSMEALTRLPGVARKTANVVLGTGFGIPSGIAVDTHVTRVAQRLGLSRSDKPPVIERDLMAVLPPEEWTRFGHRLVLHGRYTCVATAPRCGQCSLSALCGYPGGGAAAGRPAVVPRARKAPAARARSR